LDWDGIRLGRKRTIVRRGRQRRVVHRRENAAYRIENLHSLGGRIGNQFDKGSEEDERVQGRLVFHTANVVGGHRAGRLG
jgi:hypothetical protein